MKIVPVTDLFKAHDIVAEFFCIHGTSKNVVLTNVQEITERDYASGLISENTDCIFMAPDRRTLEEFCIAANTMMMYSTNIQVVIQREDGREYASTAYFQKLSEDDLSNFIRAAHCTDD